jgi:hypothetical protein
MSVRIIPPAVPRRRCRGRLLVRAALACANPAIKLDCSADRQGARASLGRFVDGIDSEKHWGIGASYSTVNRRRGISPAGLGNSITTGTSQ